MTNASPESRPNVTFTTSTLFPETEHFTDSDRLNGSPIDLGSLSHASVTTLSATVELNGVTRVGYCAGIEYRERDGAEGYKTVAVVEQNPDEFAEGEPYEDTMAMTAIASEARRFGDVTSEQLVGGLQDAVTKLLQGRRGPLGDIRMKPQA